MNRNYWKDILFQASGNMVAQIVGIIGLPILTRLYLPEDFADQAIFIQLTTIFTAFITLRFEYFIPILKNENESVILSMWVAKFGMMICVLITTATLVLDYIDRNWFSIIPIKNYYYLVPITAYITSLSFLYQHEAQRVNEYKLSGIAETVSKLFYVISGVVGSVFSSSLALILTSVFGAAGKILIVKRFIIIRMIEKNSHKELFKRYRGRAFGMVGANTLLALTNIIPLYTVNLMYGSAILGQLSLVMMTIFLPSGLVGAAVGNVFYQRAGLFWNYGKINELKLLWAKTIVKLISFALPIYIITFILSPWAYPFVFGRAWEEAGNYASIISFAAFFSFIAGPFDRLSVVLNLTYYLPIIHMLRFTLIALISFVAIKFNFEFESYLYNYSLVMMLIYVADLIAGRAFLNHKSVNDAA